MIQGWITGPQPSTRAAAAPCIRLDPSTTRSCRGKKKKTTGDLLPRRESILEPVFDGTLAVRPRVRVGRCHDEATRCGSRSQWNSSGAQKNGDVQQRRFASIHSDAPTDSKDATTNVVVHTLKLASRISSTPIRAGSNLPQNGSTNKSRMSQAIHHRSVLGQTIQHPPSADISKQTKTT